MDPIVQAVIMGIVQGLTEFLPISSSGHLVLVPWLAGWDDAFIRSLSFSVMLHLATLGALLVYFSGEWRRLVPAGLAALRDRSFADDPDRRLAWLIAASTVPAAVAGYLLNEPIEEIRPPAGPRRVMLVVGGAILWLAERHGRRRRSMAGLSFPAAVGIGCRPGPRPRARASAVRGSPSPPASSPGSTGRRRPASASSWRPRSSPGPAPSRARQLLAGGGDAAVDPGPSSPGCSPPSSRPRGDPRPPPVPPDPPDRRLRRLPGRPGGPRRPRLPGSVAMGERGPGERADERGVRPGEGRADRAETARAERSTEIMKGLRQRAIRDLVEQRPIRTQQELAAALRERGFRATQATISRDVAELGLVKVNREGVSVYALPARLREAEASGEERLRRLLRDLPVEIRESGLLLVIKTLPGSAHPIAAAIDRARWPEVVGSLAGDDTLFVAVTDRGALQRVKHRLARLAE
ncbi:MAG: hypothetical protein KatS3mg065_1156 [Chloroflexota bacterium]|nr:MAG: hypothetical protein KatS3mg065_1156 [Chloroflexota bacterium]